MEHQNVRHGFFLVLVLIVTAAFFGLIQGFILSCFWALVLASMFHRTFRRIRILYRGRSNLAAATTLAIIIAVVVLPFFALLAALVNESIHLYDRLKSGDLDIQKGVDYINKQIPVIDDFLLRFGLTIDQFSENISDAALNITQLFANRALRYTQNAITFTIQFFLMLYILFFFLRDGQKIVRLVINAIPIGNRTERMLLNRFSSVSRATLRGTLIVAIIQGGIGGVLFWAVGVQWPIFWAVVMAILSLLPAVGAGLVWLPAAIIFFTQGETGRAIVVVLVGALVIGTIDNLLRPILVGRDTKMPDFLILLTTLGGLAWFGLSGFVIGPVIAAFFLSCWDIVGKEYGGRES
jgi:predicted PurR-regulated permease PerM